MFLARLRTIFRRVRTCDIMNALALVADRRETLCPITLTKKVESLKGGQGSAFPEGRRGRKENVLRKNFKRFCAADLIDIEVTIGGKNARDI